MGAEGTGAILKINFILTANTLPQLVEYHCMRCTRLMFKGNQDILALWMGDGYPMQEVPAGMGWIEHKCRGCSQVYNIYFQ